MTLPPYDLDVRPILREGGEPFSVIMGAVEALAPGQSLRLLATFKPIPLFHVMGARGFDASAREIGNGDWEVIFTPAGLEAEETPKPSDPAKSGDDWPEPELEVDARELDPPEPMTRTLAAVESLPVGRTMSALLPREPLFLFEELKRRGHEWRGAFEPAGHYRIVIRAAEAQKGMS